MFGNPDEVKFTCHRAIGRIERVTDIVRKAD